MSKKKDSTSPQSRQRNRANVGLKPSDMTPAQRKNWKRVNRKKRK